MAATDNIWNDLLEVVDGLTEVVDAVGTFSAENKAGSTILKGQVVATHSSGTGFVLASAADNSKKGIGLAMADIPNTVAGAALLSGVLTLSDWTDVIGAASLAAKTTYFLSATAGKLTATPPATGGQVIQIIGTSISPTQLSIEIEEPILL